MLLAVDVVSRPDRIKLYPKSRCDIGGPFLENFIGFYRSLLVAWFMSLVRDSIEIMKMYGERGSACLIPLVGLKRW